jgi:hypothetical protein
MPLKRDLIYPVFLKCCNYTSDSFWEHIFEDLAHGKTPYGTYISKNFLCCNYKKKDFNYKIENDRDCKVIFEEIYKLLSEKLGLISNKQKIKRQKIFNEFEDNIKYTRKDWNNIRKKKMKELLIELFVSRIKNEYLLSIKQSRYLLCIIFIGMIFKVIKNKDINYSDGKINSINGIIFKKKEIILEKKLYILENGITPEILLEKNYMKNNWIKYVKELQKKYNNSQ